MTQFKGANFQTSNWPDPQHTRNYRQYNMTWTNQTHLLIKSEDRFTHIQGQIWMAENLKPTSRFKAARNKRAHTIKPQMTTHKQKTDKKGRTFGFVKKLWRLQTLTLPFTILARQIKQKKHSKNKIRTHKPPNMKSFKSNLITTNRSIYEKKKRKVNE